MRSDRSRVPQRAAAGEPRSTNAHGSVGVENEGRGTSGRTCLLVASSGGHLLQLHRISRHLGDVERHWVTFETPDAISMLADERVTYAFHPTNRNIGNLLRNLRLARRLMRDLRPAIVVSTGAGVGVPFCWLGRLYGVRVIFVDSFTRIEGPSLSGRLVQPVAHRYFVQWPSLSGYGKAEYLGSVL